MPLEKNPDSPGPPQCSYSRASLAPRCFWTCGFTLSVALARSLDAVVRKVLSGEYKNFGVRHR